MKSSQSFLKLGILVIMIGIFLIVVSSSMGIGTSTFFFFPFFLVSTSDVFVMFLLIGLTFLVFVIMMQAAITYFHQIEVEHNDESGGQYIPVGAKCVHCSEPLPVNAVFCSSCGEPVDSDKMSNQ